MLNTWLGFAILFLASARCIVGQAPANTTYFPYFNGISVCAPVNVLITESRDGRYSVSIEAEPAASRALTIGYQPGRRPNFVGMGLESAGDFSSSSPIKVTVSLPPAEFSYFELDYTNSDLVFNNTWNKTKGEIANNGNGNIIAQGFNGDFNKVSMVGDGDLYMQGQGEGAYSEIFSAGGGNRYVSGLLGQIKVKHDGSGSVFINPGNDSASIAGVNTGGKSLSFTKGNCTVQKDPDGAPPKVGDACTQVDTVAVPPMTIQWTCGIAVKGNFSCAGGGTDGPPTVTKIPCTAPASELTMFTLDPAR